MWSKYLPLLTLALVVAACSGGGDATPGVATLAATTTTTTIADRPTQIDSEEQVLRFVQCMRDEGVDLPDPTVGADGNVLFAPPRNFAPGDVERLQVAAGVCGDLLEGLEIGVENIDLTTITDNLLLFAGCMRDNGYDMRDPDFALFVPGPDGVVPSGGPFGELDFSDPEFIAAFPECQQFIANLGLPYEG